MTTPKLSERIVSAARHKRGIYVNGAWRLRCPHCDKVQPYRRTDELRPNNTYVMRFFPH